MLTTPQRSLWTRSADGWTALHLAAFFGHLGAARALVVAGADVRAVSDNALANEPLHAAAAGRHADVCRILLAYGADPDARQHGGFTALHAAAEQGDAGLVDLLLGASAAPAQPADDGRTAADIAAAAGHTSLADRLRILTATLRGRVVEPPGNRR